MRYPASEKLEIIRIVEQSHLPAKRTLDQLGVARRTFYRWYDRYLEGGPEALQDRPSAPSRVWNRIGDDIQDQIVEMALEQTDLSPRELARGAFVAPDNTGLGDVERQFFKLGADNVSWTVLAMTVFVGACVAMAGTYAAGLYWAANRKRAV